MREAFVTDLLLSIIALARAGATDLAWRRLEAAGIGDDDPAALAVRGRLLKDRALAAGGGERRRLYAQAADAYKQAAAHGGATYPLINAATLSFLAGDTERAGELAAEVAARAEQEIDETPYYRAATRAEALLLLGRLAAARAALAEAIARAPQAWEDHASTLRQFGMILDALGEDRAWPWDRAIKIWYAACTDRRLPGSATIAEFARLTIDAAAGDGDAAAKAWHQVEVKV